MASQQDGHAVRLRLLRRLVERAKTDVLFFNNHVRGQEPWNAQRLLTRRLAERREMNERESIHLNLADFVVAVERVLDRRLCMLPAAACFLLPRPASMGSANLVVHAANFVAPPSPNQLPSAAHSCSRGG
jgi:hypothetical protein